MKKMALFIALLVAVLWLLPTQPANAGARDSTKQIEYYSRLGYTADYMVQEVIDLPSKSGDQLKRANYTFTLDNTEASGGTADSDYTWLFVVPSGMTYQVDSLFLWAATEGDVDGDTPGGYRINVRKYDYSASGYDTLAVENCDLESLAYNLQPAFLGWGAGTTAATKVLDAGDAVVVTIAQDSAFVTNYSATFMTLVMKGRWDE